MNKEAMENDSDILIRQVVTSLSSKLPYEHSNDIISRALQDLYNELEKRFDEQNANLLSVNRQLQQEIADHIRAECALYYRAEFAKLIASLSITLLKLPPGSIHKTIRTLLKKMNITLIEPEKTGTKSTCCGDSFWDVLPLEKVKIQMKKKASEMPVDDVVVYCVSCSKSVYIGGKKPHYMIDLLFNEETIPKTYEPDEWHKKLNEFIATH